MSAKASIGQIIQEQYNLFKVCFKWHVSKNRATEEWMKETAEFVPSKVKSRMKEIHFRTTALLHEALNEIKTNKKKFKAHLSIFFSHDT